MNAVAPPSGEVGVLFVANAHEISPLKREFKVQRHQRQGAMRLFDGNYAGDYGGDQMQTALLLAITGMGRENARYGCEWVLSHYRVNFAYIVGVAGALSSEISTADCFICHRLFQYDLTAQQFVGTPIDMDQKNLALVCAQLEIPSASMLTVDRLVCRVEEKQRLFQQTAVAAVDLETYHLASLLQEKRVPWVALRCVLDEASDELPQALQSLVSGGQTPWQQLRNATKIARQGGLGQLSQLRKRLKHCAIKLEANFRKLHEIFSLDKASGSH